MIALAALKRKVLALTAVVVVTCFSHGSCYDNPERFLYRSFDYVEEWYEDTFYYDDYYYRDDYYRDDYYWDDDCWDCGDDGFGFWFGWD